MSNLNEFRELCVNALIRMANWLTQGKDKVIFVSGPRGPHYSDEDLRKAAEWGRVYFKVCQEAWEDYLMGLTPAIPKVSLLKLPLDTPARSALEFHPVFKAKSIPKPEEHHISVGDDEVPRISVGDDEDG